MSEPIPAPHPDEERLRDLLAAVPRWGRVRVVAATGSTNDDLATDARAGRAHPGSVLLSWHQQQGRGRLDRVWTAPPGAASATSVLVDVDGVPAPRVPWLSLVVGLAVVAGVERSTGLRPALKWPNDVLLDGRKVCGILAERVETPAGSVAVLGWGLNLTQTSEQLPVPTATSLALAGARGVDGLAVAAAVLTELAGRLERWRQDSEELLAEYRRVCATLGRDVVVHLPGGETVTGRALDADPSGRLVVDVAGRPRAFAVGDVVHLR
ncbi:biotin--[acetyl-CoA-carboxylase] ligase [Desertihabitans brevis]|uniref:biotin--[acetyl-CoA-carboxylase] ligase n=1 Tax=Desertihabitans brevis TaxID=2268447 RepID=UPI0018F611C6|nr:biotin--[acetyl-CoA-carboxylase] ligase [Desertihabitans brevis]